MRPSGGFQSWGCISDRQKGLFGVNLAASHLWSILHQMSKLLRAAGGQPLLWNLQG